MSPPDENSPTTVENVMTPEPMVVPPDEKVGSAYATMKELGFRHLPVVEDGKLLGIISTNDVGRLGSEIADIREKLVADVMSRNLITIAPSEPIEAAAAQMALRKVNCLPVMVEERLVGIVTTYDLLDALARRIATGQ